MGVSRWQIGKNIVIKFKIRYNIIRLMEPEPEAMVESLAVVDIDPALILFDTGQQKWITSLQFTNDHHRGKSQFKILTILPGLYLLIGFCQPNKNPIYQIEFFQKPPSDWIPLKTSNTILDVMGAHLCYKTQKSQLSQPLSDLQLLNIEKKNRFGENKQVINVPTGFKLISHSLPYGYLVYRKVRSRVEQTFKSVLTEKYPLHSKDINLSQLPIFCFPQGIKLTRDIRGFSIFNFVFTLKQGERVYVNCIIFKEILEESYHKKLNLKLQDNIFYQKALCLISRFCYTDQFGQCLQRLYRLSMSKNNVPFWKVAQNFKQSMIYPSQVPRFGISYEYGGPKITFETNQHYPFVSERSIYTIFKFLTVQHIINVFEALLLEKKILFVSQSKTILGYACEAFTSFLFPFKWEQTLIPILSSTLKEFLHAPVPLIVGISPSLVDSSIQSESVIVYLDRNQVLNDEDLPPLPEKLVKQLRKRLEKLEVYNEEEVTQYLENHESTYLFRMQQVEDPHFHGNQVRDIFLEFLLTLMRNYKRFWIKQKDKKADQSLNDIVSPQLITDFFKVEDFLSDLGMTKVGSFGFKFTESSIFTSFIEKRQRQPNAPEIVFFDSCIQKRKAKKQMGFILPVENEQYIIVEGPQPEENEKCYQYENFPSLFEQPTISSDEIMIEIDQQQSQKQKITLIIEEEYFLNAGLYESSNQQFEDPLFKQIDDLLLNKNKAIFHSKQQLDRMIVLNWFLETYITQVAFLNSLFENWPDFPQFIPFRSISKKQYLLMTLKAREQEILGVGHLGDIEILIRGQQKLFIGTNTKSYIKNDELMIVCLSAKIKIFLNSIIPKQASLLMDFMRSKIVTDLKKSAFRNRNFHTWTVETVIEFSEWAKKEIYDSSTTTQNHS